MARRATGTRTMGDLMLHPGQLLRQLGLKFGAKQAPPAVVVDQAEVELLQPLSVSGFIRRGNSWRQVLVCFEPSAEPPLFCRPYRVLRPYGTPVPFPLPARVVEGGRVVGPGSWKVKKSLFALLVVSGPTSSFEIAVPRVDVPVFVRQVQLASDIWMARDTD